MSANFGFAVAKLLHFFDLRKRKREKYTKQQESTGKVLDGNGVVTKWYRSGNEKESRKMQAEGRRKTRGRQERDRVFSG